MNRASIIGIILGLAAIVGGSVLEGGKIDSIVQGSAALIVFGGTLGATFLSFSLQDIKLALQTGKEVFYINGSLPESHNMIGDMVNLATKARKDGILSLDKDMNNINYHFFRRAVRLVIDGLDPKLLQITLEQEIRTFEEERGRAAKVFESAGGFAPTIGIIGAVLGLIHVMENLSNPTMLGSGIAVAFVATVYGVASANLVLLPIAKKMINNMEHEVFLREMIIEGVLGIQSGRSPFYLKEHLSSFLTGRT
jgi:chemotaxis protein MotA